MQAKENKKYSILGFTLIELITVIVILALLGAFAISRYLHYRSEARKSAILGVEASMQSALALVKAKARLKRVAFRDGESITLEKGGGGLVTIALTSKFAPKARGSQVCFGPGMADAIDLRDTQNVVGPYCGPGGAWPVWDVYSIYYYARGTYSPPGPPGNCGVLYSERVFSSAEGPVGAVYFTTDVSGC